MLKKIFLIISLVAVGLWAGYTGPSANGGYTSSNAGAQNVAYVKKHAKTLDSRDSIVVLTGHIVKYYGDEKYLFQDNSGTIKADIDDDDARMIKFNSKTLVKITAEVDDDFMESIELDVKRIVIAK